MRSARPVALVGAGLAAAGLCGCVSTQTKNARLVLQNERILASENAVRVTHADPDIAVTQVAAVRATAGSAVVVTLRNLTDRPLSDLPIAVAVRRRGARSARALNGGANLAYFATHVASIPARGTTIWVLDTHRLPAGTRPVVEVGSATIPASTRARRLPQLRVRSLAPTGSGELSVSVSDLSGVPQYGLPVYAVVLRDGRPTSAATTLVSTLNPGARATVHLRLPDSTGGALELAAPATIFN